MTIALSPARKFSGARYTLIGELSQNADWVQSLDFPADGNTVDISTATEVTITFRELQSDTAADLTVTKSGTQISITDADTIAINVTEATMTALDQVRYVVDITSTLSSVVTHWAHGFVTVQTAPTP